MSLVPEEVLLQHRHNSDNARGASSRKRVELEIRRYESSRKFCVCCGSGTGAEDRGRDVVQLFAVLVGDDGTGGCASVRCDLKWRLGLKEKKGRRTYNDAMIIYAAHDCCACAGGFG